MNKHFSMVRFAVVCLLAVTATVGLSYDAMAWEYVHTPSGTTLRHGGPSGISNVPTHTYRGW